MQIKAEAKPSAKKGRKVEHVHITRAGNGYSVNHRMEPAQRGPAGMMMGRDEEPKPMVFSGKKAKKDMLSHVGGLADQMGDQEGGEPEGE